MCREVWSATDDAWPIQTQRLLSRDPGLAIVVFLASALLTFAAAAFFADRLDHIGPRLGLPEVVVGLLTAVAADAPEISSALIALSRGEKQVSLGVVLGSNVFNLAAMIGVSAVLAGAVTLRRNALVIEGAVGLLATLVAGALVVGFSRRGLRWASSQPSSCPTS